MSTEENALTLSRLVDAAIGAALAVLLIVTFEWDRGLKSTLARWHDRRTK